MGVSMLVDRDSISLKHIINQLDDIDTLVILENDLVRRLPNSSMEKLISSNTNVIALDVLENATLDHSNLVLPAASFAESEGTLINYEGRAQRFFPVFEPAKERLPSWSWLLKLASGFANSELAKLETFDDVVEALAASDEKWTQIVDVAPGQTFRDRGQKIPRQTHRYSGRTAVNASVSVHEPPQAKDKETALAYSMEGLNRDQPSALTPYVWSPGWNSNQSVQKFQSKVDGPPKNSSPGVKVLTSSGLGCENLGLQKSPNSADNDTWQLVPIHSIHGSEELSSRTDEMSELAGDPLIVLSERGAQKLGVTERDGLSVSNGTDKFSLGIRVTGRMADGCAGYSTGFERTLVLNPGQAVILEKDPSWVSPKPHLIASDVSSKRVSSGDSNV